MKTRPKITLDLADHLLDELRKIAKAEGISAEAAAYHLLESAITGNASKVRTLQSITILSDLPSTTESVPLDHPIFSHGRTGRGPFKMEVEPRRAVS